MKRYPLLLEPKTKTALWGGTLLRDELGRASPHEKISESWELTVRDGDENMILNGEARGMLLSAYLRELGENALGSRAVGERFPLLIKLIDANDSLSVQVHPDDEYAHAHGIDSGKTEMWYVVSAKEGATLIAGLAEGVSAEDFRRAVKEGRIGEVMREVPVREGDVFFIPAGLLHAIGAGILIAEIQQNSDTTYRVWDFDRRGADGKLRELHLAEALEVVRPISDEEIAAERFSAPCPLPGEPIAACARFSASRLTVCGSEALSVDGESFWSMTVLSGAGELLAGGEHLSLKRGDTVFLPAAMGELALRGELEILIAALGVPQKSE